MMSKSYQTIAKLLIKKNTTLTEAVVNNPGANYKVVDALLSSKLLAKIGEKEDFYIKRNQLVWAIINVVEDTDSKDLDY